MNKEDFPQKYKDIFVIIEKTARYFFKIYYKIFLNNSISAEDLIQEAHIALLETLKKYDNKKPHKEIFKLANYWVNCRLKDILAKSRRYSKHFGMLNEDKSINISQTNTIDYVNEEYKPFNFELLGTLCNKREYKILEARFKENRTYEDIAFELGVSKQRIEKVCNQLLKKLKRRLR